MNIARASRDDYDELIIIWERSVKATHHFLNSDQIKQLQKLIKETYFDAVKLYYVESQNRKKAFIGLSPDKIEMLFVDPEYMGQGLGKELIEFAIHRHQVQYVDVNDENSRARAFYEKMGFREYNRLPIDGQGNNFPIIQMRLSVNPTSLSYGNYSDVNFVMQYAQSIQDNPWNAYYERPSTLALLPKDIEGLHILDAGCGPGIVSKWLLDNGAKVTAIDYSEEMIKCTRKITGGKVKTIVHDLNEKIDEIPDGDFDIIYASLVVHYIDDLSRLFAEFFRMLKPQGRLIFSTDHPDATKLPENILQMRKSVYWENFETHMDLYHRSWSVIESALNSNGFVIEVIKDAVPTENCAIKFPETFKLLSMQPFFICVAAIAEPS